MRQGKRKIVLAVAWTIAAGAILLLAIPFWLPWVIRPIILQQGVHYSGYQRKGLQHFVLHKVRGRQDGIEFEAERVEAFLPMHWLWHRYVGDDRANFLLVDGWRLQVQKEKVPIRGTVTVHPAGSVPEAHSLFQTVRTVRTNLVLLRNWLPKAEFRNGEVRLPKDTVSVPSLVWDRGRLSAEITVPEIEQRAKIEANLPGPLPWTVSVRMHPAEVDLRFTCFEQASSIVFDGAVLWQTNQLSLSAIFLPDGWLPITASAVAESFRVPAERLRLEQYQDLKGSFAFRWRSNTFEVDLNARADPQPGERRLLPVETVVHASGHTNHVRIEKAILDSPVLQVELLEPVMLDFRGQLLSDGATLRVSADLEKQPWLPVHGVIKGEALVKRSPSEYPDVLVSITGTGLEYAGLRANSLDASAQIVWPWLEVNRASLNFDEGATATLLTKFDLENRFVSNGVLHVEGKLGANFLTPTASFDHLRLHAEFSGPLQELGHAAAFEMEGFKWSSMAPTRVWAEWRGHAANLDRFDATLSAGNSILEASGSAQATRANAGLRCEKLTFLKGDDALYGLEQPFSISVRRRLPADKAGPMEWLLAVEPFLWRGPERALALSADIAWPQQGKFKVEAHAFQVASWADFFRSAPPEISVERFAATGSWTNGPVEFSIAGETQLPVEQGLPLAVRITAKGGSDGVALQQFEIAAQGNSVLSGRGTLPLLVVPSNPKQRLQLDYQAPISLRASTSPHKAFWDQISAWTGVELIDPRVDVEVSGSLERPIGQIRAEAAAVAAQRFWTNRELPRLEGLTTQIDLTHEVVRLSELKASVEGQPITASGQVPLAKLGAAELRSLFRWEHATGAVRVAEAQIAPFARFLPKVISPQGKLDLDVAIRPELQLTGFAKVTGGATRPLPSLGRVDDLEAQIKFAGRRVDVETCTGVLGGEPFAVGGKLDFGHIDLATGMPEIKLRLRGDRLPLARRPDLILRGDLDVKVATVTNAPGLISGNLELRDSVFLSDLRVLIPGRVAHPSERPPYFSIDVEPFANWRLDLQVTGDRFLKVRSPFFRGEISSQVKLEGTLREPIALGEIRINSGLVQFPFANLTVTYGLVSLSSADPYRPGIFVTASARTLGYEVRMEVTGTADSPVIQFSSTPPLSSEQVLLMLTTGELPRRGTSVSAQQRASRLALFLGRNLLSEFAAGEGGADRLTLRSGEYLSDEGKQTYSIEYRLTDRWSIVGEYDRFGAFNADLKWRIYSR